MDDLQAAFAEFVNGILDDTPIDGGGDGLLVKNAVQKRSESGLQIVQGEFSQRP